MAKYHTYGFEKLDVYQNALELSIKIRPVVQSFPREERYELTSQLKRAIDSIPANLAEGSGRASSFDQAHFTNMSFSSGLEVISHLKLSHLLGYINDEQSETLRKDLDKILNQLNALYKHQLSKGKNLKNETIKRSKSE